jgi:hypothetical protein
MKDSEEESDFEFFRRRNKERRAERWEVFMTEYAPQLKKQDVIIRLHEEPQFRFEINTHYKFGIVDFFPKSNKLLIRNG